MSPYNLNNMRPIEEVRQIMKNFDEEDMERFKSLAPPMMDDNTIRFIAACTEDDMDDNDWHSLFLACQGKTEDEIRILAVGATTVNGI